MTADALPGVSAADSSDRAFEGFARSASPALLRYFVRRVTPREDAADCLAETLLVIWRRWSRVPGDDDAALSWAFGVAANVLANQRRGRLRQSRLADRLRSEVREVYVVADGRVAEAIATLGQKDAELVRLIGWDGFGVAEAGAILGLSAAAARTRYSRARTRLRTIL